MEKEHLDRIRKFAALPHEKQNHLALSVCLRYLVNVLDQQAEDYRHNPIEGSTLAAKMKAVCELGLLPE